MAAPTVVAGSLTAFGAATGTSLTLTKPTGLAVGDVLVVAIRAQGTIAANTPFTLPATGGWVRASPMNTASDRAVGIYYKPIPDAAALAAEASIADYAFSGWTTGRSVGVIAILRGVDLASPIAGTSNYLASSTLGTWTPGLPYLAFGLWGDERTAGNSMVPTGTPADLTVVSNVQSDLGSGTTGSRTALWLGSKTVQVGGTAAIAAQTITWANPSSVRTVGAAFRGKAIPEGGFEAAYAFGAADAEGERDSDGDFAGAYTFGPAAGEGDSPTSIPTGGFSGAYSYAASGSGARASEGGMAAAYGFGAATASGDAPTPTGFPSVDALLGQLGGATIIHRDIATDPKACEKATHQGVLLGHGVIEFSCGWTSDLVPFMLGEQYLDTQSQVTGNVDPKSMTWAFLQANYEITLNAGGDPQPYWALEQAIQDYPDHVFCVDPKYGVLNVNLYVNAMLDILDNYGGPDRFIVKFDSPGGVAISTVAQSRGYKTMNYWGTDTTAMAAQQSSWDLIGARFDSAPAMAQANSYGKPSWAFPIDSQANYTTAVGNGADLVMVRSLSVAAVPYEGVPAGGFTSSYTFGAAAGAGDRDSEAGFSAGVQWGAASASGDADSEGGFGAAVQWGPAGASGDTDSEGGFGGGYGFGPAAASGLSISGGTFAGAYGFGPATGDGDATPEGGFSGGYGYGPAEASGDTEASGGFQTSYGYGPATSAGATGHGGGFSATYGFGPSQFAGPPFGVPLPTTGGLALYVPTRGLVASAPERGLVML